MYGLSQTRADVFCFSSCVIVDVDNTCIGNLKKCFPFFEKQICRVHSSWCRLSLNLLVNQTYESDIDTVICQIYYCLHFQTSIK